jgi:membrane protease YdiL (CAAX protease family)
MQPNEPQTPESPGASQRPPQIASRLHLAGFLLIMAGMVVLGFLAQSAPAGGGGAAASGDLASHNDAIPIYVTAALMDWALLYYCWFGVHRCGGALATLSGGRWTSWRAVAVDLGIALPFWALWEGAAYAVHWVLDRPFFGSENAKTVASLLPQSPLEILVWILVCITAGFCEELAFRGYLQRQFHALGGVWFAILGQGVVFGLAHAYQGWKNVFVISVLGILYGAMAVWRRNLRVNMITHAWADIWGGWLSALVLK